MVGKLFVSALILVGLAKHSLAQAEPFFVPLKTTSLETNNGGVKTTFQFAIREDHTLWVKPDLKDKDALGSLGPFAFDRTVAKQIVIPNYQAHEFFKLNGKQYVTLSDTVSPNSRYVMRLMPILSPKPRDREILSAIKDGIWLPAVTATQIPSYPFLAGAGTAIAASAYLFNIVSKIRKVMELRYVNMDPGSQLATTQTADRLRVKRYRFAPDHTVSDVLMEDPDGNLYSLATFTRVKSCQDFFAP